MKDEFLKIPKGLYRISTFNPTDIVILSTFMEAWRLHKHKPFTYRIETMANELNIPIRTLCRTKSTLLSMGLISQSYGKDKVCWYTVNEETIRDMVDSYTIRAVIGRYGDVVYQPGYNPNELLKECASECGRRADDKEFQGLIINVFKDIKKCQQK